ncbi:hypothetical protein JCM10450v2_004137 [Rhodotorula kratochvilovae]
MLRSLARPSALARPAARAPRASFALARASPPSPLAAGSSAPHARTARPCATAPSVRALHSTPARKLAEPLNQDIEIEGVERVEDEVDVCIVGGGPAGLSAAIQLMKMAQDKGEEIRVVVLEKGAEIGAHILSGAVIEPRALDELIPDWKDKGAPLNQPALSDSMRWLTPTTSFPMPHPPQMSNKGNYIISLSRFTRWLAEQAEELGVEIYPGFAGAKLVYTEDGTGIRGVQTNDIGLDKEFQPKDSFEPGMRFLAKVTLLAEGCHGSLSKQVQHKYGLREGKDPQTYGLGVKEVWKVKPEKHQPGKVQHTLGWPLDNSTYGGTWLYHMEDEMVSLGIVVGLDYPNPYISPYKELQRLKHHPLFKDVLEGGECIAYGARALNEGGYQSIPKLTFPGGAMIGDSAGFLNVPKIKGTHTSMKSGMLAAEAAFSAITSYNASSPEEFLPSSPLDVSSYESAFESSWIAQELKEVRNLRPSFHSKLGNWGGMAYSGVDSLLLKGRVPWTFHHPSEDWKATRPAKEFTPIEYPTPDGVLSFDLLTNLSRSGTTHNEEQPCHLHIPAEKRAAHVQTNVGEYAELLNKVCPAGVYEYLDADDGKGDALGKKLQINAANCLHCKESLGMIPDHLQHQGLPEMSHIDDSTPSGAAGTPAQAGEAQIGGLEEATKAIQSGTLGGSYGPYPRPESLRLSSFASAVTDSSTFANPPTPRVGMSRFPSAYDPYEGTTAGASRADLLPAAGDSIEELALPQVPYARRDSTASSSSTTMAYPPLKRGQSTPTSSFIEHTSDAPLSLPFLPRSSSASHLFPTVSSTQGHLLWLKSNASVDDFLHDPSPIVDAALDKRAWRRHTLARIVDIATLAVVVLVLVGLFCGWPVMRFGILGKWNDPHSGVRTDLGFGLGGANASGSVPLIPNLPGLIDIDTPLEAYTRKGFFDGETYNLVFSDEFNVDGRTFWPGDDPYWEAVDLRYWATQDYEWYDPDAITTKDGKLVIALTQEPWNGMNFRSGMLQSWNKFCFTGGYIEVSASFPGNADTMGFWPGVWTLGNLGRAGYGASVDGVWPYTYSTCDIGTLPNQTYPDLSGPDAARHSGLRDYGGSLSYLPGQRLSACTCEGEDHPGPNVNVGRGAPEIDVTEQQVDWRNIGSTSQSIQFAPMDAGYAWKNETPFFTIFNDSRSVQNLFTGAVYQESASIISLTDTTSYEGRGYSTFSFEYEPGADGVISWAVNSIPTWQITAGAFGPNNETEIGQRLINLAISKAFQEPEWGALTFPGTFRIDYIRIYQKGEPRIGCDPPDHPTAAYIARHPEVYKNPNLTVFPSPFPKNRLSATGCA